MVNRKISIFYILGFMVLFALTGCFSGASKNPPGGTSIKYDNITANTDSMTSAPSDGPSPSYVTETSEKPDPVAEQIKAMTLEEKVGQMVIAGLEGIDVDESAIGLIKDKKIGGFILFRRNVKTGSQLLELINRLKKVNLDNNGIPLFISVDEEGGRISRMPEEIVKLPAALEVGNRGSEEFSFEIGRLLALETGAFGFNMDLAPILDIHSNPENTVIGDRAYGTDAGIVSRMGIQVMKGLSEGGVIPVVKHFPGHGDTSVDSHKGLPIVEHDLERLEDMELVPFKAAIDHGAEAVMVAHILMQKIDDRYPASLSKAVITDILRGRLGFGGVVITDDMTMGAISKNFTIGDAAVKSVLAGCDIILVCHGYENMNDVIESLKNAAKDGVIPEERLDESVYRILTLKQRYGLKDSSIESVDFEKINNSINEVLKK